MSIGAALAAARRQAGLTTTEVSQRTRIRETIISAIEGDDYSPCGGDFYARGHIRSIAKVVGADPGPLIEEYDAVVSPPDGTDDILEPADPGKPVGSRRRRRTGLPGLGLVVALGLAGYFWMTGGPARPPSASPAGATSVTASHHAGVRSSPGAASPHAVASERSSAGPSAPPPAAPVPPSPAPAAAGGRTLRPASASAFGADGAGGGDNPQLAPLAIDRNPGTSWHTDWYASPSFGNLYAGTGLLVDMGRPVTISSAQIVLGGGAGGGFQLRVGDTPTLAGLRPVARVNGAGRVVRVRLAAPADGRYVLIWFTTLPADAAGTYEASVYDVRLSGLP